MSKNLDAMRAVTSRRELEGKVILQRLPRLCEALAGVDGALDYRLSFGRDELGIAYLDLTLTGELPLLCQRTLEKFGWPLHVEQRLGLLRNEREEAALPEGYEPLLLVEGELIPIEVIQDEALLALPLIAAKPGTEADGEWVDPAPEEVPETAAPSPFAALAQLKHTD